MKRFRVWFNGVHIGEIICTLSYARLISAAESRFAPSLCVFEPIAKPRKRACEHDNIDEYMGLCDDCGARLELPADR